jgi:hypothetical protein
MDELSVVMKARAIVKRVAPRTAPVRVEDYVEYVGGILKIDRNLGSHESGWGFENEGKFYICVNGNDKEERRRFTVCHEIAHHVLGLPSEHSQPSWSYAKRSPNEVLCDVFAAELLLPYTLFKPLAEKVSVSFEVVEGLAKDFAASTTATGSRFAAVVSSPCAFVLSEQGAVRFASRSRALREAGGWIAPRMSLPEGSISDRARKNGWSDGPQEIDARLWLSDWKREGMLVEDARYLRSWDQTLTLLAFEEEELPPAAGFTGEGARGGAWGVGWHFAMAGQESTARIDVRTLPLRLNVSLNVAFGKAQGGMFRLAAALRVFRLYFFGLPSGPKLAM